MGIVREFKEFISRGNVIDLAVGIIIGAAFNKIVSSLVADIIMPPIGNLAQGVKFTDLKYVLKPAETDATGKIAAEAVTINYGNFIQTAFDFLIISIAVFLLIKVINTLRKKKAREEPEEKPLAPTGEEKLLTEIRDLLKQRSGNI